MSRSKTLVISIFIALIFFSITWVVFPWDLYPMNTLGPGGYNELSHPVSLDLISRQEIYTKAFYALSPWMILSPWALVGTFNCSELGCFMPLYRYILSTIVLVISTVLIYLLVRLFNKSSRHRFFLVLCLIWVFYFGIGIFHTKQVFVDPPSRYNSFLRELQAISGKTPFPPGTELYPRAGVSLGGVFYNSKSENAEFDIKYKIPSSQESMNVVIYFEKNRSVSCKPGSGYSGELEMIKSHDDFWYCLDRTNPIPAYRYKSNYPEFGGANKILAIRYATFLDSNHDIYALTDWIYFKEQDLPNFIEKIPTFFSYYR